MTRRPASDGWMGRLRRRWGVGTGRVLLILLVFACTGTTVLLLKRPVLALLVGEGPQPLALGLAYYVVILPVYNVILLLYGALFGQFAFFWAFERRLFERIRSGVRRTFAPGPSPSDR